MKTLADLNINIDDLKIAPPTITRTRNSLHIKGDPLFHKKIRAMGAALRAMDRRIPVPPRRRAPRA